MSLPRVGLRRLKFTDEGTFGVLILPSGVFSYSLELPWRENKPNLSCIPEGEYLCKPRQSPRFGKTYHVTGVPGRSLILIHSANLAGDVELGKRTHLKGCIAPGSHVGSLAGQRAVLNSRATLTRLHRILGWQDFTLVVENESCGN